MNIETYKVIQLILILANWYCYAYAVDLAIDAYRDVVIYHVNRKHYATMHKYDPQ